MAVIQTGISGLEIQRNFPGFYTKKMSEWEEDGQPSLAREAILPVINTSIYITNTHRGKAGLVHQALPIDEPKTGWLPFAQTASVERFIPI